MSASGDSPGATPGSDSATATKDAADAYAEYVDHISNAWRR